MLMKSIAPFIGDERISEIVIVDDHSHNDQFAELYNSVIKLDGKIRLFQNEQNIGCYRNKREAVSKATNEFVCIWDSDNIFPKEYMDKIYEYGLWDKHTIYAPSIAGPFDYSDFANRIITKQNVARMVNMRRFDTMMNTMNYFVNRDEYLRVWDGKATPYAIDSIYQNLQWIAAGNKFFVVPGLKYEHTVHTGSLYMAEGHLTQDLHKTILNTFKRMR